MLRPITSIINNEARVFSLYTLEERAIPHMVDGLKPSHRFFVYSASKDAKDFVKVAAVAGRVSEYGYEHGEVNAADAGQLMASPWRNNLLIVTGRGNFGSRMVHESAASRYTFCKLSKDFHNVFKDPELCPEHESDKHHPPKHYLPVIPFVLLNGIKGIATGFATDILPHDPKSVADCVEEYIKTGNITKEPLVMYPQFNGKIIPNGDRSYILEGLYHYHSTTKLVITEIPYKYDRVGYIKVLDELEEKNLIVRYDDKCGKDNFKFEVVLKRDFFPAKCKTEEEKHEWVMTKFKLRQSVTQNLSVIMPDKSLKTYPTASELIKEFVDYRLPFNQMRIDRMIKLTNYAKGRAIAKIEFIRMVNAEEIILKDKTRAAVVKEIKEHEILAEYSDDLISMNLYHMTDDEIEKLKKSLKEIDKELKYWENTTPKKQFLSDITEWNKSYAKV